MKPTVSIPQLGLRCRKSYNQVMRDVLRGRLSGFQDDRGRWHVEADSAETYITKSANPPDDAA
jgi:hypothetical protein